MGLRKRTTVILGCVALGLNILAYSAQAAALEPEKSYSITSQDLGSALRAFAIASGKDVVFDPMLVNGKTSPGLHGELTEEEALRRILAGSGLTFERTDSGGFVIYAPDRMPGTAPDPAADSVINSTNNVFALDEVVVTGTVGSIDKFTAPYSVSTLKEQSILDKSPRSLVDLMRGQPGINAENSAGEGGNENIEIRGLPYIGFRLIDVLEDGLPFYESNWERFLNIDEVFRVDLMTQRAEIERGGTAPIYSDNASGGVVNFVTRHGTSTPEGAVQVEGGSNGLLRFSGYESGPINDQLLVAVGGSYRRDDGLRDQGFTPADDGGQIQIGATYRLDRGKLFADVKYLDDRSVVYTDIPLTNPLTGASLSGLLNPNTGTLTSSAFQSTYFRTLNGTPGGALLSSDLQDGVHPQVLTASLGGDYDLGAGWVVSDRMRYTGGRIPLDGIFNGAPTSAATELASFLSKAQAAFPGTTSLAYTVLGTGAAFNPASTQGLVIANTYEAIRTQIHFTVNDLNVKKTFDPGSMKNDVTLGLYTSLYTYSHSEYQMGVLNDVKNNPDGLNIEALGTTGNVLGSVTENGFLSYGSAADGSLRGTAIAPYVADTLHITPAWQADAGVRFESRQQSGSQGVIGTQNVDPGGPLAAQAVQGVVSYKPHSEDLHGTNYTVGSAYDFNSDLNGFVRYTHAYSMPQFTTIIIGALLPNGQPVPVSTINQAEGGLKFRTSTFQTAITAFYSHFNDLSATSGVVDPTTGAVTNSNVVLNSTTIGVEGEVDWRPVRWFDLSGSCTLQRPKVDSIQTLTGLSAESSVNDTIIRVPTYSLNIEPAYIFAVGNWHGRVFADIFTIGKRYQDFSNFSVLPSYTTLDLGVTVSPTDRTELRFLVTNVTDSAGLTEGNARAAGIAAPGTLVSDATTGRPIFGRQLAASLLYRW
jgi:outer membrane receptor protein involved in Fe transport